MIHKYRSKQSDIRKGRDIYLERGIERAVEWGGGGRGRARERERESGMHEERHEVREE